jgi:membrane associated rhomboid family serine protease
VTSPTDDPATDVEQHCYRHPDVATGVRCVRCDRPICPQCMHPASVGFQCPECVKEGQSSVREARTTYGGLVRPGLRPGLVTRTLIGLNVAVFIVTAASGANVLSGSTGSSTIYNRFALVPAAVAHGEWYRLFTSTFLHYGLIHILFNMYALFLIGPQLEAALGRLRFVVLYVLAGVGGGVLSVATGPPLEQAAGASGAIFGLFGALYVVARHSNMQTNGIVITIAANLVFTFAIPNIDWRGHVGGLITGTVIALIYAYAPQGPSRGRIQAAGVGLVAVALAAFGYIGAHHGVDKCPILATQHGIPVACFSHNVSFQSSV